jgi:uroporphyrinogen-III synthase
MKIFIQTLGGLQNLLTFAPQLKQEQLQHRPERAFGKMSTNKIGKFGTSAISKQTWRDGRVVDCGGLENR